MKFGKHGAEIHVPDGATPEEALSRATIVGIGAHPDDVEILGMPGILQALHHGGERFLGVVATHGVKAARSGEYSDLNYGDVRDIRMNEQKEAAEVGRYSAVVMLGYDSTEIKDIHDERPEQDLELILRNVLPERIYVHNPFDRHDTHVAVCLRTIGAIRRVSSETGWMPDHVYGCEVWRSLDWLAHCDRMALHVRDPEHLSERLIHVYRSQYMHDRQYEIALLGRRIVNATHQENHSLGADHQVEFAVDLMPLIHDPNLEMEAYVRHILSHFETDVFTRVDRFSSFSRH